MKSNSSEKLSEGFLHVDQFSTEICVVNRVNKFAGNKSAEWVTDQ